MAIACYAFACPFACIVGCATVELCKKYWDSWSLRYRPIPATEPLLPARYYTNDIEDV